MEGSSRTTFPLRATDESPVIGAPPNKLPKLTAEKLSVIDPRCQPGFPGAVRPWQAQCRPQLSGHPLGGARYLE